MEKECVTALSSLVKVLYLSTKTFEPFAYGQLTSKNAATRLAVECVTALIVRLPSCEYLLGVLGSIDVRRKIGGIPGALIHSEPLSYAVGGKDNLLVYV